MIMNLFKYFYTILERNFLIILGFVIFNIFIYFRFLRTRLPKDLPFNLSVLGFIILLEICIIYTYIIWTHIRPTKKSNDIVEIILNFLYQPLDSFDTSIKNLNIIKLYYPKILIWLFTNGTYIFKTLIFETCFFIIPRVILIIILIIDIFYFSALYYIYYVLVPMGIILFLRRYFIYSINRFKILYITNLKLYVKYIITLYEFGIHPSEWPENYDPDGEDEDDIPPTMALELETFINYYCNKIIDEEEPPKIDTLFYTRLFYDKYLNSGKEIYSEQKKISQNNLKEILNIAILHKYISYHSNNTLNKFKIIIYSLYLFCWLYILLKSIHNLNIEDFFSFINSIWEEITDPFSEYTMLNFLVLISSQNKKQLDDSKLQNTLKGIKENVDEKTWAGLQQKIQEYENKNK